MVFRADVVRARLLRLDGVINGLVKLRALDREVLLDQEINRWALERGLQLGAEILLDIGNHILATRYSVYPDTYEEILTDLLQEGVIDLELRERLQGLGKFRNILVHDYLRLDPDRVLEFHGRAPRDFGEFSLAIRRWLERERL
jgi:uncharacterized protein YutE (UPF0331/DUF86 family)